MDKAIWIDTFVRQLAELGVTSVKLGQLAETLWPRLGRLIQEKSPRRNTLFGMLARTPSPIPSSTPVNDGACRRVVGAPTSPAADKTCAQIGV